MLQEYFKIDLIKKEKPTGQYCITDSSSGKTVATFPLSQLDGHVTGQHLLEVFKNIFHESSTDDQGVLISYQTAKNRTLDALAVE